MYIYIYVIYVHVDNMPLGAKSQPEGLIGSENHQARIYISDLRHLSAVLFNPFSLSWSQSIVTLSRHTMNGAVSGITPCANVPRRHDLMAAERLKTSIIYCSQLAPSHHERSLAQQDATRKSHHAVIPKYPKCDPEIIFNLSSQAECRMPELSRIHQNTKQPSVTFAWTSFVSGSFGAPRSWFTFSIQAPAALTKASHASDLSPSLLSAESLNDRDAI